jgi:glc operon protein GlcG
VTVAQENKWTNLVGGIPIRVEVFVLGAIGVGTGTGAQDLKVARAALPQSSARTCSLDFKPIDAEDTGGAPHSVDKKARSR